MSTRRILAITPRAVGRAAAPSAGLGHLRALQLVLAEQTELRVLIPPGIEEIPDPIGRTQELRLPGPRGLLRVLGRLENLLRRLDLALPPLPVALSLLVDPEARRELRNADLVDLHWEEYAALAPLVRRLAPRARVVGTFHDVLSQLSERRAAHHSRALAGARTLVTRAHERLLVRGLDEVVALSEKDADLLRAVGAPRVRVVDPLIPMPETTGAPPAEGDRGAGEVGIVAAFGREANQDGTVWFLREVWPHVRNGAPGARLALIGNDPAGFAAELAASDPSLRATGFVEDLESEYARLDAVAVPLRWGSGIKFKTLEAMVRGLPTVATPVGAEGIPTAAALEAVTAEAARFADALTAVLTAPEDARTRASDLAERVREQYGPARFRAATTDLYRLDPSPTAPSPPLVPDLPGGEVSVVMPVYDGARYLEKAIHSVLDQELEGVRLIVVDDGSTDGTAQILSSFVDAGITVITHSRNRGRARAIATGIAAVTTTYVAIMGADDRVLPPWTRQMVQELEQRRDIAVLSCALELIDESGGRTGIRHGGPAVHEEIAVDLLTAPSLNHGGSVSRTAVLQRYLRTMTLRVAEDYALWAELLVDGHRFASIPQPLYLYRQHAQQSIRRERAAAARAHRAVQQQLVDALWPGLSASQRAEAVEFFAFRHQGRDRRSAVLRAHLTASLRVTRTLLEHPPSVLDRAALQRLRRGVLAQDLVAWGGRAGLGELLRARHELPPRQLARAVLRSVLGR